MATISASAVGEHGAAVEDRDAVGHAQNEAHVVLNQDDCEAPLAVKPADELRDLVGFPVAHSRGRLVEQQQAGVQREGHHDFDGPLVAVAELARRPAGVAGKVRSRPNWACRAPGSRPLGATILARGPKGFR